MDISGTKSSKYAGPKDYKPIYVTDIYMTITCVHLFIGFWMDAIAWRVGWTPSVIDTLQASLSAINRHFKV